MITETVENYMLEELAKVPGIELTRLPLSDPNLRDHIPQTEGSFEVSPGKPGIPANVMLELFSDACITHLQKTEGAVSSLGVQDLGLIVVNHNFSHFTRALHDPSHASVIPVETGISYTYVSPDKEKTRVAGSPVISLLHGMSKLGDVSEQGQEYLIRHHFDHYRRFLPDHDVTAIAMPPRRENSPTHKALSTFAVKHPHTDQVVERTQFGDRTVDVYFFAHGEGPVYESNWLKAQRLMVDDNYRSALAQMDTAWNANLTTAQQLRKDGEDIMGLRYRGGLRETRALCRMLIHFTPMYPYIRMLDRAEQPAREVDVYRSLPPHPHY